MAGRHRRRSETNGPVKESPNLLLYRKMERIVMHMQEEQDGVPIRTVKSFMTKIPSVFTGSDLVNWIVKKLDVEDQAEAVHLGSLMSAHGYFFPISDHVLMLKDDGTFYRFQTPYFWPSNCWEPENTDYAVYLCKRTMQNKARLELADYEAENLAKLQRMFARKWEFIFMQAEAQANDLSRVDKKRDKVERKILDSQERAFWDVHRPVPGCVNTTEMDIKKSCRVSCGDTPKKRKSTTNGGLDITEEQIEPEELQKQVTALQKKLDKHHIKMSKIAELLMSYSEQFGDYEPFLSPPEPSNPWITDDSSLWEQDKMGENREIPGRRVRKWGLSFDELLTDLAGREQFLKFLEKEFSAENLRFWLACDELYSVPLKDVESAVQEIYSEFLAPGCPSPINVDSKCQAIANKNMEKPNRYTFDACMEHIYNLMKSDSYRRFIRSQQYRDMLQTKKKSGAGSDKQWSLVPAALGGRNLVAKLPSLPNRNMDGEVLGELSSSGNQWSLRNKQPSTSAASSSSDGL
ncbi:PREDICTED: regulator of G-protein signaling 7-like isoform X1 [Branchiostoma belcheri]|uniref:Regulator of G-protein signaling 7-like isoform X1 n=1 Tax=Branchiostoma belcheri TaxID=7741 RepID=A0A6P4Y2L1_BRABE|nr:PREDICTED: regulator of G-protein signaling 7-like isoform X1 [Branchiostoma belcheri]